MSLQEELLSFASSVGDMFRRRVAETPDGLAFLDPDRVPEGPNTWTKYTWAESRELVDRLAAGLLARGLARDHLHHQARMDPARPGRRLRSWGHHDGLPEYRCGGC